MKQHAYKIKTGIFISLFVLGSIYNLFATNAYRHKKNMANKSVYIKLKLNSSDKVKIETAALKYNKHMAFSFTLDDGYRSAYTCAFPLLNGGHISPSLPDEWHNDQGGDGSDSKGLFFSDGCGNNIPFKLGLAINAASIGDLPVNRGHLSWPEVKEMYNAGWDILNHGYHHATKHGIGFYNETLQNITAVQQQLSFTMTQFVVPGGEGDAGYEHEYEKDAFATGAFAVASYKGKGPEIAVDKPVDLQSIIYARYFIKSLKDSINFSMIDEHLKHIDSIMQQPQPVWYNEFTHGVGDSNLWSLSMFFPEFKHYMGAIANKYGSTGTDEIWMAPWQEVYEYIWLKDHTRVTYHQNGRNVMIELQLPKIPKTFRYAAISLHVSASSGFTVMSGSPSLKVTNDGQKGHQLLNVTINRI